MPVSKRPVIASNNGSEFAPYTAIEAGVNGHGVPHTGKPGNSHLDRLRPYEFHGVSLEPLSAGNEAIGDCPFCGKESKFSVNLNTGLWRCFVCGSGSSSGGGNALTFIRLVYEQARKLTSSDFTRRVAQDRHLLLEGTVNDWGMACGSDRSWLVPGYGTDGKLDQLYRRVAGVLLPTPGVWPEGKVHSLHMAANDFNPKRAAMIICEGLWDGMALWEVNRQVWGDANIIAVPGCNVWRDEWTKMCAGKAVTMLYDSDHPTLQGVTAGWAGVQRVCKKLSGYAASVSVLRWGPDGFDPDRKSGWDVRDALTEILPGATDRRVALVGLLAKIEAAPADWFSATTKSANGGGGGSECKLCSTWVECEQSWDVSKGGAMQWRRDMSDALAVVLAVCASTQQAGNQLFLDLISSAGGGKTTICEGLLVSSHCHHLEHLTGFHSGWRTEGEPDKDCSLIARINGKTLVTPEFDIMRSSPRYEELMGQTRRIFDGKSGATYKNSDKDSLHVGLRTPWIRAGTPAIMDCDQSQLGDRFIRFIIGTPDEDEKRAIMKSALRSERVAMLEQSNGTAASILDPKMRLAHALTGGYVDWLRANVEEQLAMVDVSESVEDYCLDLADLSADLRARPNEDKRKVENHDSKELPTRLARQNIRLASCLAVVLNKTSVDADVLRILRKVALDTAAGHSLNIVDWLCRPNPRDVAHRTHHECGGIGMEVLAMWANMTPDRTLRYLMFLRKIGVLDWRKNNNSVDTWFLTERVLNLYTRIMMGVTI